MQHELKGLEVLFPKERGITEGNIAELPIWVLSNKEARPVGKSGEIRPEDYVRRVVLEVRHTAQGPQEKSLTLAAHQRYGFPTMFAFRVLVALMEEAKRNGLESPIVYISRHELAQKVGIKRPSKVDYEDLTNALFAMKHLSIEYRHLWWDTKNRVHPAREASEGFIYAFDFVDARQLALPGVDGAAPRSYVRLADKLFESLRNQYYVGVDLEYLNEVRRPLAERLYVYLTKKDGNAPAGKYSEDLRGLARKMGLKKESPSQIIRYLGPALDRLCSEIAIPGSGERRRFLERWWLDAGKEQVWVAFFKPTAPHALLRRQLSKPSASS